MSFAATLGLVALVQIGMPRLFASPDNSATARVALWGGREIRLTHFHLSLSTSITVCRTSITAGSTFSVCPPKTLESHLKPPYV
jgi:hypothetical protein